MESTTVDKIRKELTSRGFWVLKTHGSPMQASGVPDLICCVRGRFVGLEVKEPGGYPTPLQRFTLGEITKAGGVSAVVRSLAEALKVLEDFALLGEPRVCCESASLLRD